MPGAEFSFKPNDDWCVNWRINQSTQGQIACQVTIWRVAHIQKSLLKCKCLLQGYNTFSKLHGEQWGQNSITICFNLISGLAQLKTQKQQIHHHVGMSFTTELVCNWNRQHYLHFICLYSASLCVCGGAEPRPGWSTITEDIDDCVKM